MVHKCGQTAQVFQSKRTHLYLICPLCGCDQTNTAAVQTDWWQRLERLPGVDIKTPRNVAPIGATEPPALTVTVPEAEPTAAPIGAVPETADGTATGEGDNRPGLEAQGPDGASTETPAPETAPIGAAPEPEKQGGGGGLFLLACLALGSGLGLIFSGMAGTAGGRA